MRGGLGGVLQGETHHHLLLGRKKESGGLVFLGDKRSTCFQLFQWGIPTAPYGRGK